LRCPFLGEYGVIVTWPRRPPRKGVGQLPTLLVEKRASYPTLAKKTGENPHQWTDFRRINATFKVDCKYGDEEGTATQSTSRMNWNDLKVSEDGLTYTANLSAAASNPLVSVSRLVGDVDYEGALRIELEDDGQSTIVSFKGKVENAASARGESARVASYLLGNGRLGITET